MISEFENLSLGGNNAASHHGDPFSHTGNWRLCFCRRRASCFPIITWPQWLGFIIHYIYMGTALFVSELTQEQQKTLIDIRRRKTELLLEIQVSNLLLLRNYTVQIAEYTTELRWSHLWSMLKWCRWHQTDCLYYYIIYICELYLLILLHYFRV